MRTEITKINGWIYKSLANNARKTQQKQPQRIYSALLQILFHIPSKRSMGLAEQIFGNCRNRSRLEMYDVNFGGIERMTKRLTIALVALAMFVLVAAMPVSATLSADGNYYVVAPGINAGATVFIGEQGLNVTPALRQVQPRSAGGHQQPTFTQQPLHRPMTLAQVPMPPASRSVTTLSAIPATGMRLTQITGFAGALVFNVQDPTLSVNVWDFDQSNDVTGKAVPQGEHLGFKLSTNMYSALDRNKRFTVFRSDRQRS